MNLANEAQTAAFSLSNDRWKCWILTVDW